MTKAFTLLCSFVCALCSLGVTLKAQSDVCNDQINVTVNHSCAIDLTVEAFLEDEDALMDDIQNGYYTYEIYNHNGVIVLGDQTGPTFGGDDMRPYINSLLFFKIYYQGDQSCWGTVLLEDKNEPVIDCSVCPPRYGDSAADYDPECIRNCYEQDLLQLQYDIQLRDRLVQEDYEDFIDDFVTDNCDNWNLELTSYYDLWNDFGPCEGARLTRTWTVSYQNYDNTTGTVSCTREYFFKPIDLTEIKEYTRNPVTDVQLVDPIRNCLILPVEIVLIPCSEDLSPAGIASYFDDPSTVDRDSDDDNIDPDENDIDLVVENNEGIPYGFPHYYVDGVGSGGPHPQAIDNEMCNLITGYTDTSLDACAPGCLGDRKILRSWTILDWCTSQFVHYDQIIKAVDHIGPEIDIPTITASVDPWECKANVHLPHPEHIFDNCDNFYGYTIGSTGGYEVTGDVNNGYVVKHVPLGTHTIEYRSEDCCGNVGRAYVTLNVVDETPPVAVSKEYVVISLTNIGNPINGYQGTAKLYAASLDNGSYDGCSDVSIQIRRDPVCRSADAYWGDFVTFCCEDLEGVSAREIDVELRITDENGNANHVWTTVRLEDKSESFPVAPPHMILTCDMDISDFDLTGGIPEYFGACGQGFVACDTAEVIANTEPRDLRLSDNVVINGIAMEAPAYDPSCGAGALRRSFKDCGGGIQWFIILPVDPFDNTSIIWPEDIVVDCDAYDNGDPSWPETTCNLVGVSVERDTFMFDGNSCMKVLNRWSVINWCLYDPTDPNSLGKYEHTQIVKLIDNIDPVINAPDSLCFNAADNCTSKDVSLQAVAFDNGECGSQWIKWELSIDKNADWTEDYFFTSEQSPTLGNGDPNPFYIPRTTNEEEVFVQLPDGIGASGIWHRAIWRAYDGCGNTSNKMIYFQVADKKAPTPYCLNLSTAVMSNGQVELWAIDLDKGSFDNCTTSEDLLFTFSEVPPPPRNDDEYDSNNDLLWYNGTYWYFNSEEIDPDTGAGTYEDRDDYGGSVHRWEPGLRSAGRIFTIDEADNDGFVEVPVYVWDASGNVDYCLVNVRLVDNGGGMSMVSGSIATESGQAVEKITTIIDGPLNYHTTDMTDASGIYAFENTPQFSDYKISGYRNDDYMNGVSTLDLVLIQRHVLGQEDLDSPYKMIAADVNNDGKVSVTDLLELRKLILGVYSALPANGSWKLINAADVLELSNPWDYKESITIEQLEADRMNEDFIAVKIGDVNSSVVANSKEEGVVESRSGNGLTLNYEDIDLAADEAYVVEMYADKGTEFVGMQFAARFNGATIRDIQINGVDKYEYVVRENTFALSIHESEAVSPDFDIILTIDSHVEGRLSDHISLDVPSLAPEAYTGDYNVAPVSLSPRHDEGEFAVYQNIPNPFNNSTEIPIRLHEDANVTIVITDVNGRVLKRIEKACNKGLNKVTLKSENLPDSGVFFYSITAGKHSETRPMVILK